jgi:signal transduction histidine kinase
MTSISVVGRRSSVVSRRSSVVGLRATWRAVLAAPLIGKILGANLLFLVAAVAARTLLPWESVEVALALALTLGFVATAGLVWLALRPVTQLENTAARVSDGDFDARVPTSALADRALGHLGVTLNRLLDRVAADRARIQYLAGRSVRARDIERESVARELRDSFAQTLSAVAFQIEATRHVNDEPAVAHELERASELVRQLTDEMRSVAETLYPGTLSEFGLCNAIEALVRRMSRRSRLHVEVDASEFRAPLGAGAAAALYRVADEALRNVEMHANASHTRLTLRSNGEAVLEIEDDGRGVDMTANDPLQAGLGLFSAKAVLALAGGQLQISSAPDCGTRVTARVPSTRADP